MEALAHLEAIGYTVELHSNKKIEQFWVIDPRDEYGLLPETIHQYVEAHKEEIRQALRERKAQV